MKEFTRQNIRAMRPKILEALSLIEEELGVKFKLGNASFTPEDVSFKLIAEIEGADPVDVREWNRYVEYLDVDNAPVGTTFKYYGAEIRIEGYRPKARKNNLVVTVTGKEGRRVMPLSEPVRLAIKAAVK